MKKLTNILLTAISLLGTYLVSENILTAGELSDIQSILGLALAGGGVSIGMIIAIVGALPKQLASAGYEKAVATYGQAKVDGFFNKIDDVVTLLNAVDTKLDSIQDELLANKEAREELFKEV